MVEQENKLARRAYELRQAGHDWFSIAEQLQIPEASAKKLISAKLQQAAELYDVGAKTELLMLEVSRLDTLQRVLWTRLDEASHDDEVGASTIVAYANQILQIVKQRTALLGLDAAALQVTVEAVNTVVVPGNSEEYVAALRQLAERTYPGQVVYEPEEKGA